jgi:sugar phosphate permease
MRLSTLMGVPWLVCACMNLTMGLTDSLVVSMMAMAVGIAGWAIPPVAGSIWLAYATNRTPTGLAVHKLAQSATSVGSMALCGWLEPHLGMTSILLGAGCLGLPLALWMLSTPDPRDGSEGGPIPAAG